MELFNRGGPKFREFILSSPTKFLEQKPLELLVYTSEEPVLLYLNPMLMVFIKVYSGWLGGVLLVYTGETELLDIMQELTKLTGARD